ncbi:hypothetical protein [Paraburkholderia sp.]|uniref:hypothetical protein n=1 Tax=Paraburkholderia sp. TaxID=1926495 RepID=UPI00239C469D|nr:hypothetical protein [Paraburkholderia sp.]MDE1180312.1 hypothetical protein [Paraburkholderia sp.]
MLVLVGANAAVVLTTWPKEQSTHVMWFWIKLIGVPIGIFTLLIGMRIRRWTSQRVIAEESEREKGRIQALWKSWCCRSVSVSSAFALLPIDISAVELAESSLDHPVSRQQSLTFQWAHHMSFDAKRGRIAQRLTERLASGVVGERYLQIALVIDATSSSDEAAWKSVMDRALKTAAPELKFNIIGGRPRESATWVESIIDSDSPSGCDACAVIAVQLQPDDTRVIADDQDELLASSECAAVIIFGGKDPAKARASLHRPLSFDGDSVARNLIQLRNTQLTANNPSHIWLTGCDDAFSFDVLQVFNGDAHRGLIERDIDHLIGLPGPVSHWIALAIAIENAAQATTSQIVAWRETSTSQYHVCVVAPAEKAAT